MHHFPLFLSKIKTVWHHAGFQKYFKNTGWMFIGKISSLLIAFLTTAYIARNLGATNYGQLSYAVSYVGIFSFLASLGIDQILHRNLIQFPQKRTVYLGTAITLKFISSFITIFLCVGIAYFFSPKDVSLVLIFIISLTYLINPFYLLNYEFQADTKSKYPSILSIFIVLCLNILKIITITFNQGVIFLAFIILLEAILYSIGFIYLRKKIYKTYALKFNKNLAISILKNSFPLIFASAFFLIYARIDQIMLKNMIDAEAVGIYDAAVRISEVWHFIPAILITSILPAILNAKKVAEKLYFQRMRRVLGAVLIIALTSSLFTNLFSEQIIHIIFGSNFTGAILILKVYVWGNIGAILYSLAQYILINENLSKIISITAFLGMTSNVILNLIFISKYGAVGAAYASLISYILLILFLLFFKKSRTLIHNIIKTQT